MDATTPDDEVPDHDEDARPCAVCGEDVIGGDFLQLSEWRVYAAGEVHHQPFMTFVPPVGAEGASAVYLHRHCVAYWMDGQLIRLNSSVMFADEVEVETEDDDYDSDSDDDFECFGP